MSKQEQLILLAVGNLSKICTELAQIHTKVAIRIVNYMAKNYIYARGSVCRNLVRGEKPLSIEFYLEKDLSRFFNLNKKLKKIVEMCQCKIVFAMPNQTEIEVSSQSIYDIYYLFNNCVQLQIYVKLFPTNNILLPLLKIKYTECFSTITANSLTYPTTLSNEIQPTLNICTYDNLPSMLSSTSRLTLEYLKSEFEQKIFSISRSWINMRFHNYFNENILKEHQNQSQCIDIKTELGCRMLEEKAELEAAGWTCLTKPCNNPECILYQKKIE